MAWLPLLLPFGTAGFGLGRCNQLNPLPLALETPMIELDSGPAFEVDIGTWLGAVHPDVGLDPALLRSGLRGAK